MSLQPRRKIHFDDWLAAERAATQGRSEYVDGEIFAMAGGSEAHNLICGNLLRQTNGDWLLSTYGDLRDVIPLVALDAVVPLAEIYDKVELVPRTGGMG